MTDPVSFVLGAIFLELWMFWTTGDSFIIVPMVKWIKR